MQSASTPASIAVLLAVEKVPLRAIARVTGQASEDVRELLHEAMASGRITEMPRDDWPVGAAGDRTPFGAAKDMSEEALINNCIRLFKVTPLQAHLLAVLLKRNEVSKDTMHSVIESRRPPNRQETDQKMVDVVICHLRKRLKPFKVVITTLWARGYYIGPEDRARASMLLRDHAAKLSGPAAEINVVISAKPAEKKHG